MLMWALVMARVGWMSTLGAISAANAPNIPERLPLVPIFYKEVFMTTSTNVLGAAGLALAAMGLIAVSAPAVAIGTTVSLAVGAYSWAESAKADNMNEMHEDWERIIRLHGDDGSIKAIPECWGPSTCASLIAGANAYAGEHGGVGWIDMTSGKNYWHHSDSFQPKQAKIVWVRDKDAPATAFPKTKLKTK